MLQCRDFSSGSSNGECEAIQRFTNCREVLPSPGLEKPREEVVLMELGSWEPPSRSWKFTGRVHTYPPDPCQQPPTPCMSNQATRQLEREPGNCSLQGSVPHYAEQSWGGAGKKSESKSANALHAAQPCPAHPAGSALGHLHGSPSLGTLSWSLPTLLRKAGWLISCLASDGWGCVC